MKIKTIKTQHRRDFRAIYECQHCQSEEEGPGYDDTYFHQVVVRQMKCKACGKAAPPDYKPFDTKYPEGLQV